MPRRRDKRTDTQNSDSYGEDHNVERVTHFGSVQMNRLLAPDQIQGDEASKYSVKVWTNTLNAQKLLQWPQRRDLFERAIKCLPYSYKIWHMYIEQFIEYCSSRSLISKEYKQLNRVFERALEKLPKMPRIWMMFAETLEKQEMITKARQVYNWSFRNLPLTQHERIWHKFSIWSMKLQNYQTAMRIVPRYIKLNPDFKENYAQYLKQRGFFNQCIKVMQNILDDDGYHSKMGKTKQDFGMQMIDIIIENPEKVSAIDGQQFIRAAIEGRRSEDVGKLWVKLSDYFIRLAQFDKARDSLQQALNSINNAKDFGIIFNAYCKFQEQMITALADQTIQKQEQVVKGDNVEQEIAARLQKLQSLIKRQPYLLQNISLRRNTNNVKTWLKLANLHEKAGDIELCMETLQRATKQIKAEQVQEGKFSQIWIKLGKMNFQLGKPRKFNDIMNTASSINFRTIDDYLNVWISWAQILLQHGYQQDALKVIKHVLFRRKQTIQQKEAKIKNIDELLKSHTTIWEFYIDLEITVGNFHSIKVAYQRCKEHKCLSPIMTINFSSFLWENAYFQQCFRVFQFAVGNFKWPALYEIWLSYVNKFTKRYSQDGIGVERTRSMFQRLLRQVPSQKSGIFYFLYAQFQEEFGLYSHAIQIYDRMVSSVPKSETFRAYNIYIAKVAKLLGITKTRAIFQSALQKLNQKEIIQIGLRYADLQKNLAQIERARAVYSYIGQFTDPRDDSQGVWAQWQKFQVQVGDKDSYKEYLRIKRSVTAKYAMLPPDLQKIQEKVKKGLI